MLELLSLIPFSHGDIFLSQFDMSAARTLLSRKAAGDLTAVNLLGTHVEVARVRRHSGERPRVEVCARYPGEGAERLQALRREWRLERQRCSTLLPAGRYQIQTVEAPTVPEAELKAAVRWRLKDYLDYPLESAIVDVLPVPSRAGGSRTNSVYAVSARSADIKTTMSLFSRAKLNLRVIEIPEMAQRNLATLFETDQRAVAMLSFSADGGLLTFSARGELYLSRRMEVTLEQVVDSGAEMHQQLCERIALELQRSLDHFDRQHNEVPVGRLLLAPLPAQVGLVEYLAGNLSVKAETVDLGDVLDFQETPRLHEAGEQLAHWRALGTALRSEAA
jgi:MSHA biogenesis protein MshI